LGHRYQQFLGTKPGTIIELVESTNSPYLVKTADGFEFSISADDFRNYYRPEGDSTPARWFPFITDSTTGLIESQRMAEAIEAIHKVEEIFEDFGKARKFLRDALAIVPDGKRLDFGQFSAKLQELGWSKEVLSEKLLDLVAKIPPEIRELLSSETCAVVELPTGVGPEQPAGPAGPDAVAGGEAPKKPSPVKKPAPQNRRVGMKNAELSVEGTLLTITVDLSKELGPSKSGKTTIVASSEGNKSVPGSLEKIGLNIYRQESKRAVKGRRQSFKNVEMDVNGDILTIKVDLSKEFGPSRSGKTIIVASTEGNQLVYGREEKIGLNVYRKIE
jgi:hypothetical protein